MKRMRRRDFLKTAAGSLAAGPALRLWGDGSDGPALPAPTPAQVRWQDAEVGLIFHFDLPLASGDTSANNTARRRFDPRAYNPVNLDTDGWAAAAKAAGARYAIFTATHFNGFMQWQSDLYPYGLKQAAWRDGKGDVVGDFVESCRKVGLLPGLYFSTHRNVYWEVWDHYVDWGKGRGTEKQAAFNRIAERMTEELCSRYGPLVQIWYDAGVKTPEEGGPDVLPVFEKHQPDSVFYHSAARSDHRWIGNEEGHAGYPCWATMPGGAGQVSHNKWPRALLGSGDPDGSCWSPGMVDIPMRGKRGVHNWFWKENQDPGAYTGEELAEVYVQSVGRNGNLVIGEVVQPDGTVPASDVQRLEDFGKEIRRRFGKAAAEVSGAGRTIELALPAPRRIDHAEIMEDIAQGERIRSYTVEGLAPGNEWKALCRGRSVGHKRIERFAPVEVAAVRLRVLEDRAEPRIRRLAVFACG